MTLNNYTEDEIESARALGLTGVYMVFGREVGESGTPHLQGYFHWERKRTMSKMRKALPRAHWEPARGTPSQNFDYCTKEGREIEEYGIRPPEDANVSAGVKEKERWDLARQAAQEGRFDDVPSDIYVRYYRTLLKIREDHRPSPVQAADVTGVWIFGAAGTGKTRWARENFPSAYIKDLNKWWDGYTDQEVVIIDDMDPFHKSMARDFKIWCDRYTFPAEIKGGQMMIRPKLVIVTSQYPIEKIWQDSETIDAVSRRCKIIFAHDLPNVIVADFPSMRPRPQWVPELISNAEEELQDDDEGSTQEWSHSEEETSLPGEETV